MNLVILLVKVATDVQAFKKVLQEVAFSWQNHLRNGMGVW